MSATRPPTQTAKVVSENKMFNKVNNLAPEEYHFRDGLMRVYHSFKNNLKRRSSTRPPMTSSLCSTCCKKARRSSGNGNSSGGQ